MERSIKQQLISWKNKGDFCGIIKKNPFYLENGI